MKFLGIFGGNADKNAVHKLYVRLVEQSRTPAFYTDYGVPDTKEGRFDMIVLHAFLVMRRLKQEHAQTAELAQSLFDLMFADMDRNLREMGVGDLVVGKKVKNLAKSFYGRVAAYEKGLETDDGELSAALERNIFRNTESGRRNVPGMMNYIHREIKSLDGQSIDDLMAGNLSFGPADLVTHELQGGGGKRPCR